MNAKRNEFSEGEAAGVLTLMLGIGARARAAAAILANASTGAKNRALRAAAAEIRRSEAEILAANQLDVAAMRAGGATAAAIDRGTLSGSRVAAIADLLEAIAALPDPVGTVIAEWDRPNGLHIERVRTPLGVIGVIFESRPNVTADAGGLSLKAGNAVILRGGSDTHRSSAAIHACLLAGTARRRPAGGCDPAGADDDRAAVGAMLAGLDGNIDVIVPRGGRSLVSRVQEEARVPVFAHLEGVCHVYVHAAADLEMATAIVVNAKMRRTGVCGAAETLLVDKACAASHLRRSLKRCRRRVARSAATPRRALPWMASGRPARTTGTPSISMRSSRSASSTGSTKRSAMSRPTARITPTRSSPTIRRPPSRFMAEVDSAIVLHNASTQFADGGEFGMGAEIGIATGTHACAGAGRRRATH